MKNFVNVKTNPQPAQQLTLLLIFILGGISALTPFAIDMYLPAMPEIARDFLVSPGAVQQTLIAYTAGFAIGQLFHGPISDSYGRRPVLIVGIFLFLVGAVFCALADDIETLTYVRAAQGFFGSAGAVVVQALVRDMFDKEEFSRSMSFITLVTTLAPLVAPMIGGYLSLWLGWRSIFWLLAVLAGLVILLVVFLLPETLPSENRPVLRIGSTLRNYIKILHSKQSLGYIFASGFSFAGMFAFLTAGSFVYIDYYGVSSENFGFLFGLNILCLILMTSLNGKFVRKTGSEKMLKIGILIQLLAGLSLIGAQVLDLGLWGTVIPIVFYVGTISVIGSNAMAIVLSVYPQQAGTASSIAGTLRFAIATVVGVIVASLHQDSAWPMCIAIALCSVLSSISYWGFALSSTKKPLANAS